MWEQERLEDQDAETRVNAVRGLTAVCETLFGGPAETLPSSRTCTDAPPVPLKSLVPVLRGQVMDILFKSLEDYAIDNRGDVGSWVREAAMDGLKRCTLLLCLSSGGGKVSKVETDSALDITKNSYQETTTVGVTIEAQEEGPKFDEEIAIQVVGGLAKQAVEKIDRVRDVAGRTLQQLLHSKRVFVPFVPHRAALEKMIPEDTNLNWAVNICSLSRILCLTS